LKSSSQVYVFNSIKHCVLLVALNGHLRGVAS
jgi:hypothetical protein